MQLLRLRYSERTRHLLQKGGKASKHRRRGRPRERELGTTRTTSFVRLSDTGTYQLCSEVQDVRHNLHMRPAVAMTVLSCTYGEANGHDNKETWL